MENNYSASIRNATKWSTLSEILAKLITPIINMILARLLSPESFGVVASITIVTSFADIFTDAGFQRYIIQHIHKDKNDYDLNSNVALWSNLFCSALIFMLIVLFRRGLAQSIGCASAYNALAVASSAVIFTSFSSIMIARMRKELNFRPLFIVRIVSAMIPLVVTVPLAIILKSYWALVIGTLAQQCSNVVLLAIFSSWKPKLFYSFSRLKDMLSFSIWNLLESLSIWFAGQANIIIVGRMLNEYYLGLYKTSMMTVNSYMAIITASITPVLFSALSKYQEDEVSFQKVFFDFQKAIAVCVFPMGIGLFIYRDVAVSILLGNQWQEAAFFLGLWSLMSAITITYSNTACEVYRSKGLPKISFIIQMIYLLFYIPIIIVGAKNGFRKLCISSSFVRLIAVFLDFIFMKIKFGFKIKAIIKESIWPIIFSLIMGGFAIILRLFSQKLIWSVFSIIVCIGIYLVLSMSKSETRDALYNIPIIGSCLRDIRGRVIKNDEN